MICSFFSKEGIIYTSEQIDFTSGFNDHKHTSRNENKANAVQLSK